MREGRWGREDGEGRWGRKDGEGGKMGEGGIERANVFALISYLYTLSVGGGGAVTSTHRGRRWQRVGRG